ncbi:Acetyltransferase (GNAT) family protein [Amycolatopsis xylanica]|uniref:Acetyltransferase (GNAT) family protein n=1 Tax=Amycolatopsis xylanica TaxID=589385 RepID=A0A1H3K3D2_9PSEU|nr:GNAT family N-acetyltransferase [Amycolatopsis xylanica]SDY46696.1 Acetyltransferase (GNAT) family protein [Amycolatopsis xylanica]
MTTIKRLTAAQLAASVDGLAALLVDAVEDGASIGFLDPAGHLELVAWWQDLVPGTEAGHVIVFAAREDDEIVGTVQLRRATLPNALHRAELSKLVVHRKARGRGLGRVLLSTAEHAARDLGITLLLLDTETGSPAERLYRATGWTEVATVPDYARDPAGVMKPTTFFRKTP